METNDIRRIRLYNQLLAGNEMQTPQEVVRYMGAMQAQAFDMAKWAIGIRLKDGTNTGVEEAINTFKIVRTHILRPTWHFVSAEDIYWMIELTGPRLRPIYEGYGKSGGVDTDYVFRNFPLVEKLLDTNLCLTRQEIVSHLADQGVETSSSHVNQIMAYGEYEGLICSGPVKNNKHTYCLMRKHVPKVLSLHKEEALERLARRFFTSHAPATLQDFVWWSGLTMTDARKGVEFIKDHFISEEINGRTFLMPADIRVPDKAEASALLLPPFDEYVVSYKDRSEIIEDRHYAKVMTKNGLFSPTVMYNGEIIGSWRKINKNKKTDVELSFFTKPSKKTESLYMSAIHQVKEFYDR